MSRQLLILYMSYSAIIIFIDIIIVYVIEIFGALIK